jgi:very-short-patch-repair endonuclease
MNKNITVAKILETKYKCRVIINEDDNTCLYCASDIGKLLNIKNIKENLRKFKNRILIKTKTNGGIQNVTYINYDDLLKLFCKTRKPNIIEIANDLDINLNNEIYTSIEADTLKCILQSFKGEEMIQQYNIKPYFIDLYFPKYKLAIECDETGHYRDLMKNNDIIRENNIKLEIKDIYFIRYKPEEKDFNIFNVINKIYQFIKLK